MEEKRSPVVTILWVLLAISIRFNLYAAIALFGAGQDLEKDVKLQGMEIDRLSVESERLKGELSSLKGKVNHIL